MQVNKVPVLIVPTVFYLLVMALDLLVIKKGDPFYAIWDVFLCGFALLSGYLIIVRGDERLISYVITVVIVAYTITAITTYAGTLFFPQASRSMTADPTLIDRYYPYNIGGFGFVYSLVLLHPFFVFFLRKRNRGAWAVLVSVISGLCVVEAEFTTAILLFFVSCVAYLFPPEADRQVVKRRVRAVVLLVVVVLVFLPVFLNWVSQWSFIPEDASEKITDIANLLQGEEADNVDTELRQMAYSSSWKLFLKNPVFGTSLFSSEEGGGHSFFIDLLAKWGLVGLTVVGCLLYCFWKWFQVLSQKQTVGYISVLVLLMIIVLQILNPTFWSFELGFAVPLFLFETVGRDTKTAVE